jgi:hypothetical protein
MIVYLLGLYAVSLLWGYQLAYHETTRIIGRSISDTGSKDGFQPAIMSPRSTTLALILYAVILGSVVYGAIRYGWLAGIGVLVGLIIASALNKVFLLPKKDSEHFRRMVVHSLIRRHANYLKNGDELRASAVGYLLERLGVPVSEFILNLKGSKV